MKYILLEYKRKKDGLQLLLLFIFNKLKRRKLWRMGSSAATM